MLRNLEERLRTAQWVPAESAPRRFVQHRHPDPSPGSVWHVKPEGEAARLSVVVPTVDAKRGGYFTQLLKQIGAQLGPAYELIVVRGDPRQGRAINVGADLAEGLYLLILDDDTSMPDSDTFEKLVAVLAGASAIGMVGGNNVVPAGATPFVRRAMEEIPRRSWRPVQTLTDSDLAEHPCLMMRTAEFKSVGGENELIPRGLDPYLRQAFREAGLRVVVAPGVVYHHLPPDSWRKLLGQYFRNGRQAAFVNRHYPQWVIETPSEHGAFVLRVPFGRRLLRYGRNLAGSLFAGRWIWLSCQLWYLVGFLWGWIGDPSRPIVRGGVRS